MRSLATCAAIMIAALAATAPTGALANWCGKSPSGSTNCGYATLAQCSAKISITGGACVQNAGGGAATAEPEHVRREQPERRKEGSSPETSGAGPHQRSCSTRGCAGGCPRAHSGRCCRSNSAWAGKPLDFAGARQLILSGQYDAGIAAMRALKFDDHPDIATFLGLAYRKLGRLDEARAWYERALAVDPNHRLALSFYGMMRAEIRRYGSGPRRPGKAQADLRRNRVQ